MLKIEVLEQYVITVMSKPNLLRRRFLVLSFYLFIYLIRLDQIKNQRKGILKLNT